MNRVPSESHWPLWELAKRLARQDAVDRALLERSLKALAESYELLEKTDRDPWAVMVHKQVK